MLTHNRSISASLFANLFLIAPFFLWGTAMVAMKGAIDHTTPLFLAGIRLVPAGFLVLLVGIIQGRPQPQGWRAWGWIGLFALVDAALFQGFLAEGLQRTGAGLGSVMIDSQPIAIALMSAWLFQEVIGPWGWLGLVVGITGISLIGLPPESWTTLNTLTNWNLTALFSNGQWLMLLAALAMAVGTILMPYVGRYADAVIATGWHMVLGGIPLFLLSAWHESGQWSQLTLGDGIALAYATVMGSAIAYGLFFYFAAQGNLTSLSSLTFLTPVFALLFGRLLLSETLNNRQWLGVALTVISICLINQREQIAAWFNKPTPKVISENLPALAPEKDPQADPR